MTAMLLSVIVPVYLKPERFLRECIESILAQHLHDFELILIHDASPDHSIGILREYAEKDQRIRLIDFKKNSGVSVARNFGLSIAQGQYVAFVDSDDLIAPDYFETLVKVAQHFDLDMVTCRETNFSESHQLKPVKPLNFDRIFKIKEIPFRTPTVQHLICRIFLRSTIKTLCFDENLHLGEDTLFIHQAMLISKKCAMIRYKGYYYRHAPAEQLVGYYQRFCSTEQKSNHCSVTEKMQREWLYLAERLCALEDFTQNETDIQFVNYLSTRRLLRYVNLIWKLPTYEEKILYWEKVCKTFQQHTRHHVNHRILGPYLSWIFKRKEPIGSFRIHGHPIVFLSILIIYSARVACELCYVKQNFQRLLKFTNLYFRGIAY